MVFFSPLGLGLALHFLFWALWYLWFVRAEYLTVLVVGDLQLLAKESGITYLARGYLFFFAELLKYRCHTSFLPSIQ